jgi:hypothetical protein
MLRRSVAATIVAAVVVIVAPHHAVAHHSVAVNFDQSKQVDVAGTIKEVIFRNPHSQITVTVPKPEGGGTDWFIEWSDKNALVRRAVPFELLKPGMKVTITVNPSRQLPNVGYFSKALLPDGRVLRDCGFGAFRQSVANGETVSCEPQKQ